METLQERHAQPAWPLQALAPVPAPAGVAASSIVAAAVAAAAAFALAWPAPGQAAGAHEHGAARLDIAIEAQAIVVRLHTPLDNVFGFERAPRTAAERARVAAAMARLKGAAALVRLDPAAGCGADADVQIEAPAWAQQAAAGEPPAKAGAQPPATGEHADLEATYTFACARASAAAAIDTGFFAAFPGLKRIDVQVAGARGQAGRVLTAPARRIELPR